jgi:uncharacterized repeat protein (TIGR01451 family)
MARTGKRSTGSVRRPLAAFAATLVVGASALVMTPRLVEPADAAFPSTPYQTNFEVDGNTTTSGAAPGNGTGVDWSGRTATGQPVIANTVVSNLTVFNDLNYTGTGGGGNASSDPTWVPTNLNQDAITATCGGASDDIMQQSKVVDNPPAVAVGTAPADKSDICQVFVGWEYAPNGDIIGYLALTNNGNTNNTGSVSFYFELNQAPNIPPNPTAPYRTVGDILLQFRYTGNNRGALSGYLWNGTTWNQVGNGLPLSTYEPGFPAVDTDAFAEVAVNLTAAGLITKAPAPGSCDSFGFGRGFTSASQQPNSSGKDATEAFPLGTGITNCAIVKVTKTTVPADPNFPYNQQDPALPPAFGTFPISLTNPTTTPAVSELAQVAHGVTAQFVVPPASGYTITEDLSAKLDFTATSFTCTQNGLPTGTPAPNNLSVTGLTTSLTAPIECFVTNEKKPSITLVKQSVGTTGQYRLQVSGPGIDTVLDTTGATPDANGVYTASQTFPNVAPTPSGGTYLFQERDASTGTLAPPLAGYANVTLTCDVTGADGQLRQTYLYDPTALGVPFEVFGGENATCTARNEAEARLTVTKSSTPTAGTFTFSLTPAVAPTPISITTASPTGTPPVLSGQATRTLTTFGSYTLTENPPTGFIPSSVTCVADPFGDGPNRNSTNGFVANPGDTITCSATNQAVATGTITKIATGGSGTFTFDVTLPSGAQVEAQVTTTTTTATGATSGPVDLVTFLGLPGPLPFGNYAITEAPAKNPGWYVDTSITCIVTTTDGSPNRPSVNGTFTLNPGDSVACQATNDRIPTGSITKTSEGGVGTFEFTIAGPSGSGYLQTFPVTTTQPGVAATLVLPTTPPLPLGTYTITELPLAGWDTTGPVTCTVRDFNGVLTARGGVGTFTLTPGDSVNCVASNIKEPGVSIEKTSIGGTGTFTFDVTLPTPLLPAMVDIPTTAPGTPVSVNLATALGLPRLPLGSYVIAERTSDEWLEGALSCTVTLAAGGTSTNSGTFTLAAGDTVVCTITNTKLVDVSLLKTVAGATDWSFQFELRDAAGAKVTTDGNGAPLTNPATATDEVPTVSWNNLDPAIDYTIVELGPNDGLTTAADWSFGPIECPAGTPATFPINVDPGQTLACTVLNTKLVDISFEKTVLGADEWSFNVSLYDITDSPAGTLVPVSPQEVDDTDPVATWDNLPPGRTYEIRELAPTDGTLAADWQYGTVTCDVTHPIAATAGQTIACEATNTKLVDISFEKTVLGADEWSFNVSLYDITDSPAGTLVPVSPQEVDDTDPVATWDNLPPGRTYEIRELAPTDGTLAADWQYGTVTCDVTHPIAATAGQTIACEATNTKLVDISFEKTVLGADEWSFNVSLYDITDSPAGTLVPVSPQEVDDTDPVATWDNLPPGRTYEIRELAPTDGTLAADWQYGTVTCDVTHPIAATAGQTIACEATNTKLVDISFEKTVLGADEWSFNVSLYDITDSPAGTLVPVSPQEVDDTDPVATWDNLPPGRTYEIRELAPTDGTLAADWQYGTVTCDVTHPIAATAGQTIACEATNTKLVDISITKTVEPASLADWSFDFQLVDGNGDPVTTDGNGNPIADTPPATKANPTVTWANLDPAVDYEIVELGPTDGTDADWKLGTILCDAGAFPLDVAPGDVVSCTVTNTKLVDISFTKTVTNLAEWSFSVGLYDGLGNLIALPGLNPQTVTNTDPVANWDNLPIGIYEVRELTANDGVTNDDQWIFGDVECTVNGSPVTAIATAPGDVVACTAENTAKADLELEKTVNGLPNTSASPGETVTYVVTVTNNGPADAENALVTDAIPTELQGTLDNIDPEQGTCDDNGATLDCDLGTIAAGTSVTITYEATLPTAGLSDGDTLVNTAVVSTDTEEWDETNNEDSSTVVVGTSFITVIKEVRGTDGGDFSFTLTGPSFTTGDTRTVAAPNAATDPDPPTNVYTWGDLTPGAYTLDELLDQLPDATWRLSEVECSVAGGATADGDVLTGSADITLPGGGAEGSVVCTFTNETFDLSVEKSADVASITAGDAADVVTWSITVTNEGSGDAFADATVTDVLPDELVWDEASVVAPAGVTCEFAGQTLTCTIPAAQLTAGASVTITAEASAPADTAPGPYENAVVVDSPEDPDCAEGACAPPPSCPPADLNNAVCTPVDVDTEADVSIVKTVDPAETVSGGSVTYTLVVSNAGPSDAVNVTVSDLFPAELENVSIVSDDPYTCVDPVVGNQLTCTIPAHPVGVDATITVTATVVEGAYADLTPVANTATVGSETDDPDETNNTSTATFDIRSASLTVTKVTAGGEAGEFEVTITDDTGATVAGDSLADGESLPLTDVVPGTYTVTETLPGGLFRVAGIACSNEQSTTSNTLEVTLVAGDDVTCTITNETFDLSVEKSADVASITAGDAADVVTWSITVTNEGSGDAFADATVTDVLPDELVWDEASVVAPAGVTCEFAGQTLTCTIPAAQLTAGASVVITAEASAPADTAPGTYENAVVVSSPEDPDCPDGECLPPPCPVPTNGEVVAAAVALTNNQACEPVQVDALTDMTVTITATPGPYTPGEAVPITVTVENLGPSDAEIVQVVVTLPAEFVPGSISGLTPSGPVGYQCTPDLTAGTITCTVPVHQVGDVETITFSATLVSSGLTNGQVITIPATVSTATPESDPDNNDDTDLVVIQLGGLSIVKVLDTTGDFPSGTFRFVVERLDEVGTPIGVVFDGDVSASLDNPGTQVVTGLSAGRYRVTEIQANPLVPFRFVSAECQLGEEETIIAEGPSIEAYVGAGDSVACIFTNESFNLKMGKTDGGVTVTAGTNFAYTLTVTKQGFGAATSNATVTDTLPGDFTWIGTPAGAGATCAVSADAKSLTCTVTADQLNTGSAVISGQVRAPASMTSGTYTNTAVVDSPEDPAAGFQPPPGQPGSVDPYAADNTASDTTPVVRQAAVDIVKVDDLITDGFTVPGGTFRYTMTVANPTGPSTATGVTIADTLPAGLTLVSAAGTNWSCTAGTVNCAYTVPIEVGATSEPLVVTVTVSTGITADTTLVNTATATCVETALAACTDSSTEETPVKVPVLPPTGADPYRSITIGVSLFAGGWLLVLAARWRRRQSALV